MPYPTKVDRPTIIKAALALVEREGGETLALRRVASTLGVSANALYRYFDSREVLVAATADAVGQRLYEAVDAGMRAMLPSASSRDSVRMLLTIYAAFANDNPALYAIFIGANYDAAAHLPGPKYHELLWRQSLAVVERLVGAEHGPSATVALWGLVHGIWALRQAGVLGGMKPAEIDDYAFDSILRGLG
jgi:AcrR family transcriptional regulator